MAVKFLSANDLRPGVRFKYDGHPVEILRDREQRVGRFGQMLEAWWSRRADTGDEGYVYLGPGGILRVEPLKVSGKALRKKTAAQIRREVDKILAGEHSEIAQSLTRPINKRKRVRHFSEWKDKTGHQHYAVVYEDLSNHAITSEELNRYRHHETRR